ncbi:MAG: ATP-binding protein [Stellaceae bacterium]
MFSARLNDLRHTTSFRLGLLFVGLFGAASLLLFGFVYSQTLHYVSHEIDAWLSRESIGRASMNAGELARSLDARTTTEPDRDRPIALFRPDGTWVAGDRAIMPAPLPPMDRPFHLTMQRDGEAAPFRGIIHRLASEDILLVAQDMRRVDGFRVALLSSSLWAGGAALLLGLIGAVVAGTGALGRLDRVTSTTEHIINGDLSRRLPSDGRGGDLDRLVQVVNRMLDEIERLMHEVRGVTEDIAHDLRTPLTRLLAGLERVQRRGSSTSDFKIVIDEAIAEAKGILTTFAALLRIAEVESGARRSGFKLFDLNTIASDVVELYEPVAESKDTALLLETSDAICAEIIGDSSLLFEALSNLLDNAIKYSPPGSKVSVRVLATDDRLGIEVTDTGPGIPEAEREAVLRRFHRIDKSRTAPGSGLGLSLVAAVAKLHDFQLTISDALPGCRISICGDRQLLGSDRTQAIEQQITATT